jgi:WhiB family redox-sensing transcriptional regulator
MTQDTNWQLAACIGEDPELWFRERSRTVDGVADTRYAKDVCHNCLIRSDCLDDAMRLEGSSGLESRWGVRGGLTGPERYNLRRRLIRMKPTAA